MASPLSVGDVFPLTAGRYGVAISWDHVGPSVDVDLQAVIIDDKGQVIDAVYYNNLKALRCITHSGDEVTGEKTGFDEVIWLGLSKMPANVKMVVFVVAAFQGGHLRDAVNGKIHILEESQDRVVADFQMERSEEEVDAVAMMVKAPDGRWSLQLVNEPARDGQHFIDILEPVIGNIVRGVIPGAPRRLKVAFAMEKGSVVDLPKASAMRQIKAGLGWDTSQGKVDLDVSAVLFDAGGAARDAVFFGNLEAYGIKHSGDNLTGDGNGDDETITVDFGAVPDWVQQIFFCVNIYTNGVTFSRVANPYCRILDGSTELARYELLEAGNQNGLVIARLFRESLRWGFQAVGRFCRGQTWKDSVPEMAALVAQAPRELQQRQGSCQHFAANGPPQAVAGHMVAPSPAPSGSACCALL